jgi:hypothetical protein
MAMTASPTRQTPGPSASAAGMPISRSRLAVANSWQKAMRAADLWLVGALVD